MIGIWNSSRVRRWHMHPEMSVTNDFVDGHGGRVARMVAYLGMPHHVVTAALFHDDEEAACGDMSSPAKALSMDLYELFKDQILATAHADPHRILPLIPDCTADETGVIRMCDRLDAEIWLAMHTRRYGAQLSATRRAGNICQQLIDRGFPQGRVLALLPDELRDSAKGFLREPEDTVPDSLEGDHIITRAIADELIRRGACKDGAEAAIGMTVAEAVKSSPKAALAYAGGWLSDAQFAEVAKAAPSAALRYTTDRLTAAQLAEAAKGAPWAALEFAANRLTDAQLDEAARAEPWSALKYAAARLTDEQFAEAAEARPYAAKHYDPCRYRRLREGA